MHPYISKLISNTFYEGEVENAPQLDQLIGDPSFYEAPYSIEPISTFYIRGMEEFIDGSYVNVREAEAVVKTLWTLHQLILKGGKFPIQSFTEVNFFSHSI